MMIKIQLIVINDEVAMIKIQVTGHDQCDKDHDKIDIDQDCGDNDKIRVTLG